MRINSFAGQQDSAVVEVSMGFVGQQGYQTTPPHLIAVLENNDILVYRGFYPGM